MTRPKALLYGGAVLAALIAVLAATDNLSPETLQSLLGAFSDVSKETTP